MQFSGARGPPQFEKKSPIIWAEINVDVQLIPRVAPSIGFFSSHVSRSREQFRDLLRECPGIPRVAPRMTLFCSLRERLFSKIGVDPRLLKFGLGGGFSREFRLKGCGSLHTHACASSRQGTFHTQQGRDICNFSILCPLDFQLSCVV